MWRYLKKWDIRYKKLEMPFLMLFNSVVFVCNYDIFVIFLSCSVKKLRVIVFLYVVDVNLENERLEKFTSFPYITSGYIPLCRLAGENNVLAVYFSMLASAIGKLYIRVFSNRLWRTLHTNRKEKHAHFCMFFKICTPCSPKTIL